MQNLLATSTQTLSHLRKVANLGLESQTRCQCMNWWLLTPPSLLPFIAYSICLGLTMGLFNILSRTAQDGAHAYAYWLQAVLRAVLCSPGHSLLYIPSLPDHLRSYRKQPSLEMWQWRHLGLSQAHFLHFSCSLQTKKKRSLGIDKRVIGTSEVWISCL